MSAATFVPKSDRISDPFLGPFSIGTLSTGSKTGIPFLDPRLGRRSTATTFTLELTFGTMKSGRGSKKQCQMQSDNLYDYVASSHRSTAAKKSRMVPARCKNACTHWFLHLAATVEALCARTGFSGLVNEPAKPSKTVGHSIETISTGVAFCSYGYCRNHVGTLNGAISSILGAGHGMAKRDAAGCPSKSVACPGTEFGCKICILCADCTISINVRTTT